MRVLWITNTILPPIAAEMNIGKNALGGWMYSSLKRLALNPEFSYAVATVWNGSEFVEKDVSGVKWFLIPTGGKPATEYNAALGKYWLEIQRTYKPDVVHVHGSEFPMGLVWADVCGPENVVVSIQGLISCCAERFTAGLENDITRKKTFRDMIKGGIHDALNAFVRRGEMEIRLLKKISYVIGRTQWDKAHVKAVNPEINYSYCGESLRDIFYTAKWDYSKCEPYSIFVSQGNYPIKGTHKIIQAMPYILREFPEAKLYVAGTALTSKPWYLISSYPAYLKKLIIRNGLESKVVFTGMLDEERMCEMYLKSNIFVSPSAIENSSNAIGEAQMLGMPLVASFVGGTPDIVDYSPEVLYRFDDEVMLADKICRIFRRGAEFIPTSFDAERYNRERNVLLLEEIYRKIKTDLDNRRKSC